MRNLRDISGYLLKLLLIITTVLFLSACAKDGDTDSVIGENIATSCDENDTECRQALCLGCSLLQLMYDAASEHVMSMHASLTGGAMAVMMVGFSIWLALRLLKFVSSVTETNAGEVWNEIVRKAFVCLICGLLASSSGGLMFVMNMLIFPVYRAFMELGVAILNNSLSSDTANPTTFTVFGSTLQVSDVNLHCSIEGDFRASEKTGFPPSLIEAMVCMMRMVSGYLTIGSEIAFESMRQTSAVMGTVMGIVLYAFFWVVKVGFSFYLVDMIFQMSIIILLLPLYVMSYAFGPTQSWAKKAFSNVLASSAFMMCFSVIVATVLVAMVSMLQNHPSIFNPEDLEANMRDLSIGFMCLLLIGFLVYGSMGVSQQLTSALLGAKVSANFQKNLKAAVQAIGGAILSGIGALVTWGMSLAPQSSIRLIRAIGEVNEKVKAYRAKIRRLAGRK